MSNMDSNEIRVLNLGTVLWDLDAYHDEDHVYPVGYVVHGKLPGIHDDVHIKVRACIHCTLDAYHDEDHVYPVSCWLRGASKAAWHT